MTAEEEKYWQEHHANRPFAKPESTYDDYAHAYKTGHEAFQKYPGKDFEEIEDEVALDYERSKPGSALPWDHARHAVHAVWAKLGHDVGPRDSDRGIRSGI